MNKTETLSTRVTVDLLGEVDTAAHEMNLKRSEWLEFAIARQLGRRPRLSVNTRLAAVEKQVEALGAAIGQ